MGNLLAALTAALIVFAGALPAAADRRSAPARSVAAAAKTLTLTPPERAALRKVLIPVLVPAVVPASLEAVGIAVASYTDNEYALDLVASPTCVGLNSGGGACTQASVEGRRPAGPVPAGYRPVRLSDGSTAYYVDGPCGANCGGSFQFTFVRGSVRYTIGIKAGKLAQALAIERGLRVLR